MTFTYIRYPLAQGYVDHWLVAGPQTRLAPATAGAPQSLAQHFAEEASGVTEPVVDLGPLTAPVGEGKPQTWHYYRCEEDHLVDLTAEYAAPHHLRAWAYAQIQVPEARAAQLVVSTHGPTTVWVNGHALPRIDHWNPGFIQSSPLNAELQAGANEMLVRFEMAGAGPVRHALAVRLVDLTAAEITLPTNIEADLVALRQITEYTAYKMVLDRYVYGSLDGIRFEKNQPIPIMFAPDLDGGAKLTFRLQSTDAKIYQEATKEVSAETTLELAKLIPLLFAGRHNIGMGPVAEAYYQKLVRFERLYPFYYVRTPYAPYSLRVGADLSARTKEALTYAAELRGEQLYSEIAKMAAGLWEKVTWKIVQRAVAGLGTGAAPQAVFELMGLLGFLLRYPSKKKQTHLKDIRPAIQAAALAFRYWPAESNGHASAEAGDFASEHRQLAYHTAEILAGQLWPEAVFAVSGQTGKWHREHGEALALAWLRQRGALGFTEWDSPNAVEANVAALSYLLDLADHEQVSEVAAILLDKVLFGLAVNTYKGAFSGSKGRADTESVLTARLSATSGLTRLLWAQGNFNQHLVGIVSLATCRDYQLPELIRQIAVEPVDAVWNQERYVRPAARPAHGDTATPAAAPAWEWEVNKVVYKTKDFMLACAQDYRPGQPGSREHIWQATLGPDAVVFVNHPTSVALDDAHAPNLWVGNGVLPRAAQWGDVLVAVHQLPADDWLGYTHAYFPARVFDEHTFQGHWAFARTGTGYLAITAARGLDYVTTGPTAFRELRSAGHDNVWICHMGQALLDGSFAEFQQKILALDVNWQDAGVQLTSLRGDRLSFGWTGPLVVNGDEQPLVYLRHIENPYSVVELPATQMDVIYKGEGIRLKFD